MSSRQTQRTLPGRGSFLLVSFPTLYKRSSSPPLIKNSSATPAFTSQFIRLIEPPPHVRSSTSPQHGKPSAKVLRENNSLQNSNVSRSLTFSGNKKSFSALDLRAAQRMMQDSGRNFLPRKENLFLTSQGGIEISSNASRNRSTSTSTNIAGDRNTYAHGSILKKSAFKNQPGDYQTRYLEDEFLNEMKSKRKVLFKNKVSVFRFDSDADAGRSSSEYDKRRNQAPQCRWYRTMTPKNAFVPPKSSHPPPSLTLRMPSPFQRHLFFPPKPKPKSAVRDESVFLTLGDDSSEAASRNINKRSTVSTSTSTDNTTDFIDPQQQQQQIQHQPYQQQQQQQQQNLYESISYRTPPGSYAPPNDSVNDLDIDSFSNPVSSSRSSRDANGARKPQKISGADERFVNSHDKLEKQSKKEAVFGYHVTSDSNKLVISVRLGLTLHPNDVLVKANKIGTKLRIVANPESNSSFNLNEQILLPIHVDPYKLSAKIDQSGNLLIEAPITE